MTKAIAIAKAVNGSGYGTAGNLLQYVTNLSQQPGVWFNLSASFVGIDPPGELHSTRRNAMFDCLLAREYHEQVLQGFQSA